MKDSRLDYVEKLTEVISFLSVIYLTKGDEREMGKHIQALLDVRTFLLRSEDI